MLVLIFLFTIATSSEVYDSDKCYGVDLNITHWDRLIKIDPTAHLEDITYKCIYGTPVDPTTPSYPRCENGTIKFYSDSLQITPISSPTRANYPTCKVGNLDCSKLSTEGKIIFDFANNINNISSIVGKANGTLGDCTDKLVSGTPKKLKFGTTECSGISGHSGGDITIIHQFEIYMTASTNTAGGPSDSIALISSPRLELTTECSMSDNININASAWKSVDEKTDSDSKTATIDFSFDLAPMYKDQLYSNGRYMVVIGESIDFEISWDKASAANVNFYLNDLDATTTTTGSRTTFSIIENGCKKNTGSFEFTPTRKTIGSDPYTFRLKAFGLKDTPGAEFDLEATIKLCNPATTASCDAPSCTNSANAVNARKKRSTKVSPDLEEIQLSTGPFVLLSKEQISGAKAVGWMLPLSIFNILLILQYL